MVGLGTQPQCPSHTSLRSTAKGKLWCGPFTQHETNTGHVFSLGRGSSPLWALDWAGVRVSTEYMSLLCTFQFCT